MHQHDHEHDHAHDAGAPQPANGDTASTGDAVCHRDGPCAHGNLATHDPGHDVVCLDHVSFAYPGARRPEADAYAIKDVTLHIEQGCSLGIIGPNGAGKTTLLKIMLGLLDGYEGDVRIFGMTPREACRRGNVLGYVPQRHDVEWRFPVTVEQAVCMGLVTKTGLFRRYAKQDVAHARELMHMIGIDDLRDRPVGDLSGGQQQRVFIARALVAKPQLLILDEPMVGIDETGQERFSQMIHGLHETLGLTLIIVSHDIQAVAAGCNRVACLKQTLHYHDAPQGLTPQVLHEVFHHEVAPVARKSSGG